MIDLSHEEPQEVVESVWFPVTGVAVSPGALANPVQTGTIMCSIVITGAWCGVVRVRTTERFLSHAASVMFNSSVGDVTHEDRADAMCELTNMPGGSIKSLLPESCDLALPHVVPASEVGGDNTHVWMGYRCHDEPLAIAVTPAAETE